MPCDRRMDVERARQVVDDRVEQGLDALVLERGAAQHGHEREVGRHRGERGCHPQVLGGDLLVADVLLEDVLVVLVATDVEQLRGATPRPAPARSAPGCRRRPRSCSPLLLRLVPDERLHREQVDDALVVALGADRAAAMTAGTLASRRSLIMSRQRRKKSAPTRSILFTKHMRGTRYLLAWRHTVSVWGSTPATASNTATAPSSTRSDRSTSTVKSTWPGVSMMLIHVVAPLAGRRGRRDGDAALLLLDHPVHDRRALVDLTDLVGAAGVVEDALGRGGLARVDVGHDPDVPHACDRHLPGSPGHPSS